MRHFYQLLLNTTIAGVVNFTVWFAIIFFVYLETHSVFATSVISGIWLVATAASGFWLGSLVDHHRKKTVMLLSSVVSMIAYLLSFIVYSTVGADNFTAISAPQLWILVLIIMAGVLAGNLRNIALPTIVTILVKEDARDKANGLVGTAGGISFLITSVISGLLVGHSGMQLVLLLAIVFSAFTIIHLWLIPVEEKVQPHTAEKPKKLDLSGTVKVIRAIPGLFPLIFFTMINNFLGGVFMSLMDAYGLSMVSVEVWGILWGVLSTAFIFGGMFIAKFGLGKNPVRTMFIANLIIWSVSSVFTVYPSIVPLLIGMFIYLCIAPFIEAAEHTIIQKLVPAERQGRVFGFAQSIEQAASPLTAFAIGPVTQFVVIPFMTTGAGVKLLGPWFGTGPSRAIALVFTIAGILGLMLTFIAYRSKYYKILAARYVA